MTSLARLDVLVVCRGLARGAAFWVGLAGLASPHPASAQLGVAAKTLTAALADDEATKLGLRWQSTDGHELRISDGTAALLRCTDATTCAKEGEPLPLSTGERSQLVSRLRATELFRVHSSDSDAPNDRTLILSHASTVLGTWRVPRADWPIPPDGYGLADYLDDLRRRISQAAQARKPLAVPQTVEGLRALRLQIQVEPRRRPGGRLQIESGQLRVVPEEGFVPRSPAPRAGTRPLTQDEEQHLLSLLQQARLDDLDRLIEKRDQPAIGDDDGRPLTLHLLPSERATSDPGQARGLRRYVADLERSPAGPLVQQLLSWLTTPLPAPTHSKPRARR